VIKGVVITLMDITETKILAAHNGVIKREAEI
jgi:hypothetical protein